jgi:hypothetical protein
MKKINWKYAIGEIIIVIIGITIAFSLNNWKEESQNKKLKRQYLESMRIDIEKEIQQLKQNDSSIIERINKIEKILSYTSVGKGEPNQIFRYVFEVANTVTFDPVNSTYQTMINSGDMKLINDFHLRRKIEEHYNSHSSILKDYGRLEAISKKYVADFFIYEMDYERIRKGDFSFLKKPILKNIYSSLKGAYLIAKKGNSDCIQSNKELLKEIKLALE